MKAIRYYSRDLKVLEDAIDVDTLSNEEKEEIAAFFSEHQETNYNEFLMLFNERYGNIVAEYRKRKIVKILKHVNIAAIIFIVLFIISVICVILSFIIRIISYSL